MALDLDIQYRPGKANARADALSRYPVPEDCTKTQTPALVAAMGIPSSVAQSVEKGYSEATLSER